MLEVSTTILIIAIMCTSSFFAAHYVLRLQISNNDLLAKLEESNAQQIELDARILQLESQRDNQAVFERPISGYDAFDIRR